MPSNATLGPSGWTVDAPPDPRAEVDAGGSQVAQRVSDVSLHPGEDQGRDLLMVADEWEVLAMTADGQIKVGPGAIKGFRVIATSSGVFALYDGTSTSGRRITEDQSGLAVGAQVDLMGERFSTGLYFELVSGTCTVNVRYR